MQRPAGRCNVRNTRSRGPSTGAVDTVEAEVRELVRRRGLDPVVDRSAMRTLINEVVTEYDARSLTSSLPQLTDSRKTARAVYDVEKLAKGYSGVG